MKWITEFKQQYLSGAASQFILHGNIEDKIPDNNVLKSLPEFIHQKLFKAFDVVVTFDIGRGLDFFAGKDIFMESEAGKRATNVSSAKGFVDLMTKFFKDIAIRSSIAKEGKDIKIALILRHAGLFAPNGQGYEANGVALGIKDWASDSLIKKHNIVTVLLTETLSDVHPLIIRNPQTAKIALPKPDANDISDFLKTQSFPIALGEMSPERIGDMLKGVSFEALERMLKIQEFNKTPLKENDVLLIKKEMIESECSGLIQFIESNSTLDDMDGSDEIKTWIRNDLKLWRDGKINIMPMGYLLCGPVGTGKTWTVKCIAGEAGVPVVVLGNYRDKYYGASEANLEKALTQIRALGKCIVFIDEADQALGKRQTGDSSSEGTSGRLYSSIAQEMSRSENRGRILWVFASSRPDLIEIDLKRPGRIDTKIPLFPTSNAQESYKLLSSMARRKNLELKAEFTCPSLLTPGAAESILVQVKRKVELGESVDEAFKDALDDYLPPVSEEILNWQIALAVNECTEMRFIPEAFKKHLKR